MLKTEIEYKDKILFVKLSGRLTRKESYKINNYINPVIKKHGIKNLIYDVSDLKSIDEFGIDAIRASKVFIKNNKGKILLYDCNNTMKNLTEAVHIRKLKKLEAIENGT